MTADDKDSLLNRDNLTQPIRTPLSQKQKGSIFEIYIKFRKTVCFSDDKDSLLNRDNLTQPIRTPLSQKQKAFSELFVPFSKFTLNFEHSQKKDDPHS